jgi:hypothetical protein
LDNDLVGVLPKVKRKDARASSHSSYECVAKTMYGVDLKYLGAVRRFAVYHKYEDDYQKRAFREIIYEISDILQHNLIEGICYYLSSHARASAHDSDRFQFHIPII